MVTFCCGAWVESYIFLFGWRKRRNNKKKKKKKGNLKGEKRGNKFPPNDWAINQRERENKAASLLFSISSSLSLTLLSFAGALNDLSSSSSDPAASRLVVNYFSSLPLNLLISSRNLFPLDSLILIAVLILLGFDFVMFLFSITITMID